MRPLHVGRGDTCHFELVEKSHVSGPEPLNFTDPVANEPTEPVISACVQMAVPVFRVEPITTLMP